jgi:Protein tyrosine and serine/threonine kinase
MQLRAHATRRGSGPSLNTVASAYRNGGTGRPFHREQKDPEAKSKDENQKDNSDLPAKPKVVLPAASRRSTSESGSSSSSSSSSIQAIKGVQTLEKIGEGRFGTVYKGTYHSNIVAVKKLPSSDAGDRAAELTFGRPNHPNLVRAYGISTDALSGCDALVMEFFPCGSLEDALRQRGAVFPLSELTSFATNVAYALAFLGSKHVIHRDVACRKYVSYR